ncbi:hypothetical protein A2U01_0061196, partial [Trifolium medium]|nr:hypothetical protein [Trifolium medium]
MEGIFRNFSYGKMEGRKIALELHSLRDSEEGKKNSKNRITKKDKVDEFLTDSDGRRLRPAVFS